MADLFSGLEPQQGPFANVPDPTSSEAPVAPLARFRQAQVAAMANLNPQSEDLFQEFQALQEQYQANIEQFGEGAQRASAAHQQVIRNVKNLQELSQTNESSDPTGQLQAQARQAVDVELNADISRREKAALEQEAVDRVMDVAGTDPEQATLLLNLMEFGSPLDQIRDMNTKQLILQREIDRAQSDYSQQAWYRHVTDFLLENIPLNASMGFTGNVTTEGYDGMVSNLMSQVFSGGRRRAEAASLWNMPAEDFGDYVREQLLPAVDRNSSFFLDKYQSNTERLNILSGLSNTPRAGETNTWNAIDNVGLLAGGSFKVGKAAVSVPNMLMRMGGRKQAGAAMAQAAAALAREGTEEAVQRAGMQSADELTDALLPTSSRPGPAAAIVGPHAIANNILAKASEIMEQMPTWLQPGRFTDTAEYERAVNQFIDQQSQRFNSSVVDTAVQTVRTNDGSAVTAVEFTLGKKGGDGWIRESDAQTHARGLGFADSDLVQGEDGKYFVKITRNMPETGVYTNPLNVQTNNIVKRFLSGARERSDINLANMAQRSEGARNRIINDAVRVLWKEVRVDPVSRERLANLWQVGENQGKWWNLDEANSLYQRTYGRDISQREWLAYQGLRQINDIEYIVRNDMVWKEKVLRGAESGTIDLGYRQLDGANMIFDENFTKGMKGRGLNVSDGTQYTDEMTAQEIESLKNQGFIRVHLDEDIEAPDGSRVHSLIVRRQDVLRERLRRTQLAYRAGGHRIYEEKYFAKQTRRGTQADGSEFFDSPNTYMVGTRAQVAEWTDVMNSLRVAVRDNPSITAADLDAIVGGRVGYPTGEQFLQGVTDGTYRTDFEFGNYFDRELPKEYDAVQSPFVDTEEDGITSYMRTHGRLYYSQKGQKGLVDWQGEQAPTLDAWQSTNQAFLNIANMSSFSDYKLSSVERWVNTFGGYLEPNPALKNNMQRFMDGKISAGAKRDGVEQAMLDQRDIIKRNLGWKTEWDMQVQQQQRKLAEWVMGTDPKSLRHGASRATMNFMEENNPLQFMRGLAFDLKLGLFSPVQLFLQSGTMVAMTAIDPIGGLKGLRSGPLLRSFMMWNKGDDVFINDAIKRGLHEAVDMKDPEEFRAFMGAAKSSGFFSINDSHSLINSMGPGSAYNITKNKMDEFRQAGRFFFNEGEMWNRLVAYRSAWDHTRRAFPDIDSLTTDDFLNRVAGRAEDLAMSMSRTSQANWQQGLASLPTQFWAYQARMMEAMMSGVTGKGRFTRQESWNLMLSQMFMYGAAGIPLAPVISDLIKQKTGEAPELHSLGGLIDRGVMDQLWGAVTGSDMLISDRLGTGGWLGDTVGSLMGLSKYGEQSTADILGGATFSIANDLREDILPILKYSLHEAGGPATGPLTERAVTNLARNITSLSVGFKVNAILKYGHFIDSSGKVVVDGVPSSSAFGVILLGAQPGQTDDISAMASYYKNKKDAVDEASKVIQQYRQELFNHPDRVDELSSEINLFVNLLDEDIRTSAIEQAHDATDPSLYASYANRRERDRQQKALMETPK